MNSDSNHNADKARILVECAGFFGVTLGDTHLDVYLRVLSDLTPDQLQSAINAHLADTDRGRWMPKPADILAKVPGAQSYPGADEAWALALASYDETDTVILTDVILEARNIARDIWASGDEIGARMAFRAAYERLCRQRGGQPHAWRISIGSDPQRRVDAIGQARAAGLISERQAQQHLPTPGPTANGQAIAGLLTGKVVDMGVSDEAKKRLGAIREMLEESKRRKTMERQRKIGEEQEATEARRAELLDQAESLMDETKRSEDAA